MPPPCERKGRTASTSTTTSDATVGARPPAQPSLDAVGARRTNIADAVRSNSRPRRRHTAASARALRRPCRERAMARAEQALDAVPHDGHRTEAGRSSAPRSRACATRRAARSTTSPDPAQRAQPTTSTDRASCKRRLGSGRPGPRRVRRPSSAAIRARQLVQALDEARHQYAGIRASRGESMRSAGIECAPSSRTTRPSLPRRRPPLVRLGFYPRRCDLLTSGVGQYLRLDLERQCSSRGRRRRP